MSSHLFALTRFPRARRAFACAALALLAGLAGAARADEAGRIVFVTGQAQAGARALALGDAVAEGDELHTGADGFVYMRTTDQGLLILRPNSRARIVAYHVDRQTPANTRVKLELLSGVARSISGQAVKQARQNFRFNTPVAAIGVRGTDFTVFTDQETSRVTVLSGAIVVSGFEGMCRPGGAGPCESSASRELSALQGGQMLQVRRGQATPQLLNAGAQAPDAVAPPRPDEPLAKNGGAVAPLAALDPSLDPKKIDGLLHQGLSGAISPAEPATPAVPQSVNVWGRWQAVLGSPATIDTAAVVRDGGEAVARNTYYALYRTAGALPQLPTQGSVGFALRQSEALLVNEATHAVAAGALENGRLTVDFGKASFATGFDLVSGGERFKLQARGELSKDGRLGGENQFKAPTNMAVSGALGDNGASAAYIFSSRIDERRVASGVTYWGK